MAATALAEPNNRLRADAELAEVSSDVTFAGDYVAIEHGFTNTEYVWCEPVRLGGADECFDGNTEDFDTLYLGVAGPDGGAVHHTGQVSVYYDTGEDGWQAIIAQFNGKGELLRLNGERV